MSTTQTHQPIAVSMTPVRRGMMALSTLLMCSLYLRLSSSRASSSSSSPPRPPSRWRLFFSKCFKSLGEKMKNKRESVFIPRKKIKDNIKKWTEERERYLRTKEKHSNVVWFPYTQLARWKIQLHHRTTGLEKTVADDLIWKTIRPLFFILFRGPVHKKNRNKIIPSFSLLKI